jgi:hypothetical protein
MALMEGWPDESKEAAQLVIDSTGIRRRRRTPC